MAAYQWQGYAATSAASQLPVARGALPKTSVSRHEAHALKRMATRMLAHTVSEFEQHTHDEAGVVDTSHWKALGARGELRLYREREAGAMCAAVAFALQDTDVLPRGSTVAPLTPPGALATGYARGQVENIMHALSSGSQQDLALLTTFMLEDVADCAVLHTLEAPSETNPFRFFGVKYVVRKPPMGGGTKMAKHRDLVFLEYTGYTETTRGARLGFRLVHSVELSGFPDAESRNCVRTLQSVRYLYRQQSEDVVEVFMQGNIDISMGAVGGFTATFASETLFGVSRLVACAEAKQLTNMWQARRQRQVRRAGSASASECSMCRQKKKFFGGASLSACDICAEVVCSRCLCEKKVFERGVGGILGAFRKLSVCKCCVLAANKPLSQPKEPHELISMAEHLRLDREGSRERRRRGTASSGTRSRSGSSCVSTSSDEGTSAPLATHRAHQGSAASSASTPRSVRSAAYSVSPRSIQGNCRQRQRKERTPRRVDTTKQTAVTEAPSRFNVFGVAGGQLVQQQLAIRSKHAAVQEESAPTRRRGITTPSVTPPTMEQKLTVRTKREPPVGEHAVVSTLRRANSNSSLPVSVAGVGHGVRAANQQWAEPTVQSARHCDLFARMVELNRVAESTYNTAQQNAVYASQQMRSRRGGGPAL